MKLHRDDAQFIVPTDKKAADTDGEPTLIR